MHAHGSAPHARGGDAALVVRFLNTVACPVCRVGDALDSDSSMRAWSRATIPGETGPWSEAELRRLRRFRQALGEVMSAAVSRQDPPPEALEQVNASARQTPLPPSLRWTRRGWVAVEAPARGTASARVASAVAGATIRLLAGPEGARLKECEGPGCAHFLLARTRNQIWCSSTGCGNRVRVARHYLRQHSGRKDANRRSPGAKRR
jgi:predicted RNA-binding Zn ribbon-like protein